MGCMNSMKLQQIGTSKANTNTALKLIKKNVMNVDKPGHEFDKIFQ